MNVLLGFEILKHLDVGLQEERVGSTVEERECEIMKKLLKS